MRTSAALPTALAVALLAGCAADRDPNFLGSAVVEARTYKAATTAQGFLTAVLASEGDRVAAGDLVAQVDTVPLALTFHELDAARAELNQIISSKRSEISSLEEEIRGLAREYGRIGELADKGSIPMQQKDDLGTKMKAAGFRLDAAKGMLASLEQKRKGIDAKGEQVRDQIARCSIKAPATGIVTARYKNAGEVLGPGMPVLEVGAFDTVYVEFFVPQVMLAEITFGQKVTLRLDCSTSESRKDGIRVAATVGWISDEAEFSPRNIQTRESRNELMFRVRATVANADGLLKRGLPVEVWR